MKAWSAKTLKRNRCPLTAAATSPWQAHGTSSLLILHDLCINFAPVTLLASISFQELQQILNLHNGQE